MNRPIGKLLLLLSIMWATNDAVAQELVGLDAGVKSFFETYCLRCHDALFRHSRLRTRFSFSLLQSVFCGLQTLLEL